VSKLESELGEASGWLVSTRSRTAMASSPIGAAASRSAACSILSCSAPVPCWKVAGKLPSSSSSAAPPSPPQRGSVAAADGSGGGGGGGEGEGGDAGGGAKCLLGVPPRAGVPLPGVPLAALRSALRIALFGRGALRGVAGCGELARACRAGVLRSTRGGVDWSSAGDSGAAAAAMAAAAAAGGGGGVGVGGASGERATERLTLRSDLGGEGGSGVMLVRCS
jgi:hypothetical protein